MRGCLIDIVVICPSRGRPGNIVELVACWSATGATARLVVCVDDDDPTLAGYYQAVAGSGADLHVGSRQGLCGWLNTIAVASCRRFDVIGAFGDDVRPRTPGWDTAIATAMTPRGVVYGNDLHQHAALPTHPFLDAEIVRRLGYLAPPEIVHLYIDNVWKAWGEALGTLTYLPDVVLEHLHPHAGKADMDDGYRAVNSRANYRQGRAAFDRYMAARFAADVEALR